MSGSTKVNIARLTARERRFLFAVIAGKSGAVAYLEIAMKAGLTAEKARAPASRMLARIKTKVDWPRLLEAVDLGELRLFRELERKLKAMTTKFYEDRAIIDVEDNSTQMRAVELLADLLGRRKGEAFILQSLEARLAEIDRRLKERKK